MKVLKGVGLSILGFLLSLSLFIFGILFMVNQTALNPGFVVDQVDKVDIPSLAGELFSEEIPPGQEYMTDLINNAINETIAEQEDWIKEQVSVATYAFYDYLEEKSQSLSIEIPTATIMNSLRDNLWEGVLASPPPEFAGLTPAQMHNEFNQFWSDFSQDIPATFEIDEDLLGTEGMDILEQARQYIGYFHMAFWGLIGLTLLLILGIVLIHRQVRGATRGIGIIFLTEGVITLVGVLLTKNLAGPQLANIDMPAALQTWAPQFLSDILAPLLWYSVGLLVAGVALLVVSFVYKPRQDSL